jgi:hypothetical protein
MEELKEFNLLDYKITSKEIVDAIHHLKNGKTSGLEIYYILCNTYNMNLLLWGYKEI